MKLFKNIFLFIVGVVTIAFDEVAKSVDEAIETVKEQH